MRKLVAEVAGLPIGARYEIYEIADARRVAWIGPDKLRKGRRILGPAPNPFTSAGPLTEEVHGDATLERAYAILDHHAANLGIHPEELIPCGYCDAPIAACLTVCPCSEDPDGRDPCPDCDLDGNMVNEPPYGRTGMQTIDVYRNDVYQESALRTCATCNGDKEVEAPHAGERDAAIRMARAFAESQKAVPVPAGIGGRS